MDPIVITEVGVRVIEHEHTPIGFYVVPYVAFTIEVLNEMPPNELEADHRPPLRIEDPCLEREEREAGAPCMLREKVRASLLGRDTDPSKIARTRELWGPSPVFDAAFWQKTLRALHKLPPALPAVDPPPEGK